MCGISVSLLFAIVTRLTSRNGHPGGTKTAQRGIAATNCQFTHRQQNASHMTELDLQIADKAKPNGQQD
jgi:hypothetical protein